MIISGSSNPAPPGYWLTTSLQAEKGRRMAARGGKGGALIALGAFAFMAALALTALAADAHHNNPACTPGSYTQVWNGTTTLPTFSVYNDQCILVRGDIVLPAGSTVHFIDTDLTFANNEPGIGNISVSIANDSVFEMSDGDNDPATLQDRSGLFANDTTSLTFGFFFNVSLNASLYINDTVINGGGLPGAGLNWRTGFYLEGLKDFAWNRVDHTFLGNGLMLVNFGKPRTLREDEFSGAGFNAGYGLYMAGVGNLSIQSLTANFMPYAVYINDSYNISIQWFNSTASATGVVANRVTILKLLDALDNTSCSFGMDFNSVTNLTVWRARMVPPAQNICGYGIELENSRDISLKDLELGNHANADLHIWQGTQNLRAESVNIHGTNTATSRGIWAVEAADIFKPSNFTFISVSVSQRGEGINLTGVGRSLLQFVNISSTVGFGLYTAACFDLLFTDGSINGASGPAGTGTGAYLGGNNITIQRALIASQGLAGVEVGESSFVLDGVTFQANGRSVRTSGPVRIGPSVIANSTIPAGAPADAVNLIGADTTSFTRLFVFHNNFTSPCTGGAVCYGLRIDTFGRVDVVNNTFFSLPVAITNTSTLVMTGNSHRVSQLPLNAVVILFDHGLSLTVSGEFFPAPSAPAGISTVIRVPSLSASAVLSDMRLPLADFGIWVSSNLGSALLTSLTVYNVTASARRDAVTSLGMNTVAVSNLTVDASTNGVILFGGGANGQDLSVRDAMLTANGTAVNLSLDSAGRALVDNITLNRSSALPGRALSIQGGSTATVSRIALDRVAAGIVTSDLRRMALSQQDFTNNSVGLRMDAPTVTSADLNWTITAPALIENTLLRFGGAVTVKGTSLTLRNASLALYALATSPRLTRFFIAGASTLTIADGTQITTEAANTRNTATQFTIQMSPQARLSLASAAPWGRVVLDGLGDPASPAPEDQGILLQAQDTTVANVTFLNFTRPLLAVGISITVVNCTFAGGAVGQAALTVSAGGRGRLTRVVITNANGIEAKGGDADVDNSSVSLGGVVLDLNNSRGTLTDSVVQLTSSIVTAVSSSNAEVCRVVAMSILTASFVADSNSIITVCDSTIRDVRTTIDAIASNGAVVTLNNTFIDRFNAAGHNYTNDTRAGGTIDVIWTLRFAVCVLSSFENATGARVEIFNSSGSLVFSDFTDLNGYTGAFTFHEYHSQGGVAQYWTPIRFVGTVGALVNSSLVYYTNQTVLQVCVDDVPPVITIISRQDSRIRDPNVEIDVLATDTDSGLQIGSPCVAFSGDAGQPCHPMGANRVLEFKRFQFNRTLLEGPNWFRIEAVDLFGNTAVAWVNITLDTTGPVITSCVPTFTERVNNGSVDVVCTVEGDPKNAAFRQVIPTNWTFSDNRTLRAHYELREGTNEFNISVIDDLGNYAGRDFAWTVDTTPPAFTLNIDPTRIVTKLGISITGNLSSDTVSLTLNGTPVNFSANRFTVFATLKEGDNLLTFAAVDAAGNPLMKPVHITVDTLLNCTILAPLRGQQTPDSPIGVSGHCDSDVSIVINGDLHVQVNFDGSWSTHVGLVAGPNKIVIDGTDSNGALWHAEVPVYYAPGTAESGPGLLILFALMAVGTILAAFFIARRPRDREFEPVPHSQTGSQKAPPRPQPQTVKLPETQEDLTYRPKPPTPPPPRR
jgi:hypothetical protein